MDRALYQINYYYYYIIISRHRALKWFIAFYCLNILTCLTAVISATRIYHVYCPWLLEPATNVGCQLRMFYVTNNIRMAKNAISSRVHGGLEDSVKVLLCMHGKVDSTSLDTLNVL